MDIIKLRSPPISRHEINQYLLLISLLLLEQILSSELEDKVEFVLVKRLDLPLPVLKAGTCKIMIKSTTNKHLVNLYDRVKRVQL